MDEGVRPGIVPYGDDDVAGNEERCSQPLERIDRLDCKLVIACGDEVHAAAAFARFKLVAQIGNENLPRGYIDRAEKIPAAAIAPAVSEGAVIEPNARPVHEAQSRREILAHLLEDR